MSGRVLGRCEVSSLITTFHSGSSAQPHAYRRLQEGRPPRGVPEAGRHTNHFGPASGVDAVEIHDCLPAAAGEWGPGGQPDPITITASSDPAVYLAEVL